MCYNARVTKIAKAISKNNFELCITKERMIEVMTNTKSNLEIERKFLIEKIDLETLRSSVEGPIKKCRIEQIYLAAKEGERRIRKQTINEKTSYFYTEKVTITELKRTEKERRLAKEEYEAYKKEADDTRNTITKTRYVFEFKGQTLEIDFYDWASDKAILEIEIPNEKVQVELPDFIKVIKEVTYDKAYKNHSLAKTQSLDN